MFQKSLFIFAHQLGERGFYPTYKKLVDSQWKPYSDQKKDQENQLKHMISFAYKNVPYYHKLFNKLKLDSYDIRTTEDLEKLPILTKDIIKQNFEDLKPVNLDSMKYYVNSTGGSTGTPLQFRLLKYDRFFNGVSLYRGWGYAGYELGDKMVFLAGSSLDVGSKSFIVKKAHEISRNIRKLSSFDMSTQDMQQYAKVINSFKPEFIRGYPSSINFFANFLDENKIDIITPHAILTTAEKSIPSIQKNIKNIFGCDVYDAYGLNDGGLGAYECSEHNGLHIDTERSIMEIVDDEGLQLENGVGKILATSLHNYAMPFIRYDTGDMGHIVDDICGCGRGSKLLKEVIGRSADILLTPEGKHVHGYFILYIFWDYGEGIKEYQVIQEKIDKLVIKIVAENKLNEAQLDGIREIIRSKSEGWEVEFRFVDKIERTRAGKYKYIINEL
ncbi:MAG: phenylacetate--CoA ligase family protein [Methanosarcina sp.]|uniref:phenylacetate--CoA ligase family protein n=1 Tax=Methanosarcina sp. TaxID=2213 RepID=UPI0026159023|nr:phenylacetate--CoA ligase family protein [Methanosarcina sp.]MDD3247660.1 phenylacetate--CoA ligase family protein [Methanosarcina sp.]MDD4249172.1 phenylacetate--CoA ligase family protein [Methanosarcina sp.]